MEEWRQRFTGDLGLYSYYRKYAWRSLPVMLPHYMQQELRWYTAMGFRGISTYAEPGDWYTYGLNHYVLAGLAWNTGMNVDSLMDEFLRGQYGGARGAASGARVAASKTYRVLEEVVRKYGSIPYTRLKSAAEIDSALGALRKCKAAIASANVEMGKAGIEKAEMKKAEMKKVGMRKAATAKDERRQPAGSRFADDMIAVNLGRLGFILDYAIGDLEILALRVSGASIGARVKELAELLEAHDGEGLFVLHGKNNFRILLNHYNSEK
jgi:hypothetical protein